MATFSHSLSFLSFLLKHKPFLCITARTKAKGVRGGEEEQQKKQKLKTTTQQPPILHFNLQLYEYTCGERERGKMGEVGVFQGDYSFFFVGSRAGAEGGGLTRAFPLLSLQTTTGSSTRRGSSEVGHLHKVLHLVVRSLPLKATVRAQQVINTLLSP